VMNVELKLGNYRKHKFHSNELVRWISETLELETNQTEHKCNPNNTFGCGCGIPKIGKEYSTEVLVRYVVGLTEEERKELIDLKALRIYGCPRCQSWSLDVERGENE
jgi:Zn finger protein HypA/HybF involved in hydrogenase expression